mmetsp:Transcript_27683/g.65752  ORF Transcript_27683/g.65752 Transcript_27683/m.65752 type:complete len:208 (+) Transcript_27683:41-664(+)
MHTRVIRNGQVSTFAFMFRLTACLTNIQTRIQQQNISCLIFFLSPPLGRDFRYCWGVPHAGRIMYKIQVGGARMKCRSGRAASRLNPIRHVSPRRPEGRLPPQLPCRLCWGLLEGLTCSSMSCRRATTTWNDGRSRGSSAQHSCIRALHPGAGSAGPGDSPLSQSLVPGMGGRTLACVMRRWRRLAYMTPAWGSSDVQSSHITIPKL